MEDFSKIQIAPEWLVPQSKPKTYSTYKIKMHFSQYDVLIIFHLCENLPSIIHNNANEKTQTSAKKTEIGRVAARIIKNKALSFIIG